MTKISLDSTLGKLSETFGGTVQGDPSTRITSIAALPDANPTDLAPVLDRKFLEITRTTSAGALLTNRALARKLDRDPLWIHPDPRRAIADLLDRISPIDTPTPFIHPSSVIDPSASIHASARIEESVVIQENVSVGRATLIGPKVVLGKDTKLGHDCTIGPGAMILDGSIIGDRVKIGPGAIIGSDGFGFLPDFPVPRRVRQIGFVEIEDDVDIGAHTVIDRATLGKTVIGRGSKLDNLIQVGHNVSIGQATIVAAQTGFAGSAKVGSGVLIGGQVGIADHLSIGDRARLAAKSGVVNDIEPGTTVAGYPAIEHSTWLRVWGTLLRKVRGRRGQKK